MTMATMSHVLMKACSKAVLGIRHVSMERVLCRPPLLLRRLVQTETTTPVELTATARVFRPASIIIVILTAREMRIAVVIDSVSPRYVVRPASQQMKNLVLPVIFAQPAMA